MVVYSSFFLLTKAEAKVQNNDSLIQITKDLLYHLLLILLRRFLGSPFPINEIVINLFWLFIDNINDERCYFSVWSSLQMFNTMMILGTWIFFLLLAFLVSL